MVKEEEDKKKEWSWKEGGAASYGRNMTQLRQRQVGFIHSRDFTPGTGVLGCSGFLALQERVRSRHIDRGFSFNTFCKFPPTNR